MPQRNLHVVPDSISTDAAVFTEPLAAALQITTQLTIHPGDRVIVLGDGRLGNLCAQVLAQFTRKLLVVGKHPEKLALLQSFGIPTCLLQDAPVGRARRHRRRLHRVEDGPADGAEARASARDDRAEDDGGRNGMTVALASVVVDEITIIGSRCGPFDRALAALESGSIQVLPLISERYDLSQGIEALERAGAPGVLKVLLDVRTCHDHGHSHRRCRSRSA